MQFGLMTRGQFHAGDDMQARFQELMAQARLADQLGFASLTKGSHYSAHPYQDFQQLPYLARVSAEAPNLRINAGIVLVPLHKPMDLAEQLATLDVMTNGKLIFGAGLGYRDVEFKGFGTSTRQKVRRFEENIEAIKRLWTEETVDMVGSHFELMGASCPLKPIQKPHPPIIMGAASPWGRERVAQFCDGWVPLPAQMKNIEEDIADLEQRLIKHGRKLSDIEISFFWAPDDADELKRYRDLGVNRAILACPAESKSDTLALLDKHAKLMHAVSA